MAYGSRLRPGPLLAAELLAAVAARVNFVRIPLLPEPSQSVSGPKVSIIVPARNEAPALPTLLSSLRSLEYPDFEIIVVDDRSDDATAAVAVEAGAVVVRGEAPPAGWTGKSWACAQGARRARGRYLLFTDADTWHAPTSLHAAVSAAQLGGWGLLSVLTHQECKSFWERVLLPYAYALYFVGALLPNRWPASALANGQFMLFERGLYEAIGGHDAVRGSLIEDVALARVALRRGGRVKLYRTRLVHVRMYSGLPSIWEGFSKNAFRFVSAFPITGAPTVMATAAYALALPAAGARRRGIALCLPLVPALGLAPWLREWGIPLRYSAAYPLAAIVFQALALDSIHRSLRRHGTVWKGRRY